MNGTIDLNISDFSSELELGKCGEYYAIFKLSKQGFICFPSDQGLPYDIVVQSGEYLLRGQVRTTLCMRDYGKSKNVFRFSTRTGKGTCRATNYGSCDFYAFVVIEEEKVGFMAASEIISDKNIGSIKQTIEFRTQDKTYPGRVYPSGKTRFLNFSRNIEAYESFNRVANIIKDSK
ncbi:hypothetical protein IFY68_01991 [Klebsiella pneumoniae]|uniref:hypothetical protein n=1 Tax=Klebsiella TaxID=570 RepID=UPI000C79CDB3|nr:MULTISPECIES: hypothetical protein [Klebsiella]QLT64121.1 hypothetical protein HV202_10080 [Klebsiella oxytoca]ELQ4640265.1 hypothetical protein [Klebsiella pneumoniae]MBS4547139.1 hypothetical protein [Klebsiella pneumoniae]MBS4575380.1 hypothetical protein [Klebsiella pneumoniae]MBS4580822.1 hypothetical protein [Klebsiella pneumoniae]